jgi:K+-sensing histidine kinase KdpD
MISVKYFFNNVYLASILGIAAILLILKHLQFVFGGSPQLLLFLLVIAVAAWGGGLRAGLFATVTSAAVSAYFLIEPFGSFYIENSHGILRLTLLIIVGAVFSLIIARLYNQQKRILHQVMERKEQLKQEIAERNRTQADRDLYASLVKSSTEFIGMCDPKGVPFFINEAGLHLVGLDNLEQVLNTPRKEFFFPEDQAFIINEFFLPYYRTAAARLKSVSGILKPAPPSG